MRTSLTLLLAMMTITSFAQLTALDSSFANNGILKIDNPVMFANGSYIALQTDGKIVVAGTYNYNTPGMIPNGIALMRFNPNGTTDTSLNHTGVVQTPTDDYVVTSGVAVQPDNKITVLASTNYYQGHTTLLARYKENGALDPGFNDSGKILYTNMNTFNFFTSMLQQADGKVLIAGKGSVYDVALNRYTTSGRPDSSFGFYGAVSTPLAGVISPSGIDMALQSNGKIIVGGNSQDMTSFHRSQFMVCRFDTAGLLDATFGGGNGFLAFTFPNQYRCSLYSVAVKNDGKILACGVVTYKYEGAPYYTLVQLDTNGAIDSSFGSYGKILIDSISTAAGSSYGKVKVVIQADGKILIAMGAANAANKIIYALYRLLPDGSRDTSFGLNGLVTTQITQNQDITSNLVVQPDGKILVAGLCNQYALGGSSAAAVVRYKPNIKFNNVHDKPTELTDVTMYPNPATNKVTIGFTLTKATDINIDLYDVYGRKLKEIVNIKQANEGAQQYSFALQQALASGTYFVNIKTGGKGVTRMLVKQ